MKREITHALKKYQERFLDGLATSDTRHFRNAMCDFLPGETNAAARNLLQNAFEINAFTRISKVGDGSVELEMAKLLNEMIKNYSVKEEAARVLIECIVEVYGLECRNNDTGYGRTTICGNDDRELLIMVRRTTNELFAVDEDKTREYSFSELMELAYKGNTSAECAMGDYYNAQGVNEIPHEALFWYQRAAKKGHAKALWNLGNFYGVGKAVPQDFDKALEYLHLSVERGCIEAMHSIGVVYVMSEQYERAASWFEKAKAHGLPDPDRMLEAMRLILQAQKNN